MLIVQCQYMSWTDANVGEGNERVECLLDTLRNLLHGWRGEKVEGINRCIWRMSPSLWIDTAGERSRVNVLVK